MEQSEKELLAGIDNTLSTLTEQLRSLRENRSLEVILMLKRGLKFDLCSNLRNISIVDVKKTFSKKDYLINIT